MTSRLRHLILPTLTAMAIGAVAGIAASVFFNGLNDVWSHLICGLIAGSYSIAPGILIGIAGMRNQTASRTDGRVE